MKKRRIAGLAAGRCASARKQHRLKVRAYFRWSVFLAIFILGVSLMLTERVTAQNFSILHNFDSTPGSVAAVLAGPDGALYGTTTGGGTTGFGTIFKVNADGTGFNNLYSFTGGIDGGYPQGAMVLSGNTLYGTTGTSITRGTVFKINYDGTGFATIITNTGVLPCSLVISGNTLYGTVYYGGILFQVNTDGSGYAVVHSFTNNTDGSNPDALILSGNTLYGTTASGGANGEGTLFSLTTNGNNFTVLHTFSPARYEGSSPLALFVYTNAEGYSPNSLLLSGNRLYVSANLGGPGGYGTVISFNTDGTGYTNLHAFTGIGDGYQPKGLVLSGKTLYGTAAFGGSENNGTVFSVSTGGVGFATLHVFSPLLAETNSDGAEPQAGLVLLNGILYGTAFLGSSSAGGDVFAINPDGNGFTNIHSFPFGRDGSGPAGLMLTGNTLYGTTEGEVNFTT